MTTTTWCNMTTNQWVGLDPTDAAVQLAADIAEVNEHTGDIADGVTVLAGSDPGTLAAVTYRPIFIFD